MSQLTERDLLSWTRAGDFIRPSAPTSHVHEWKSRTGKVFLSPQPADACTGMGLSRQYMHFRRIGQSDLIHVVRQYESNRANEGRGAQT
jgi:hypothetical protein